MLLPDRALTDGDIVAFRRAQRGRGGIAEAHLRLSGPGRPVQHVLPDVGDEVLLGFQHGDSGRPAATLTPAGVRGLSIAFPDVCKDGPARPSPVPMPYPNIAAVAKLLRKRGWRPGGLIVVAGTGPLARGGDLAARAADLAQALAGEGIAAAVHLAPTAKTGTGAVMRKVAWPVKWEGPSQRGGGRAAHELTHLAQQRTPIGR